MLTHFALKPVPPKTATAKSFPLSNLSPSKKLTAVLTTHESYLWKNFKLTIL